MSEGKAPLKFFLLPGCKYVYTAPIIVSCHLFDAQYYTLPRCAFSIPFITWCSPKLMIESSTLSLYGAV